MRTNFRSTAALQRVTELLKHSKLDAREELKIWLGYAMGNYSECKREIEALFPDLLRSPGVEVSDEGPNISRVNQSLTDRWRYIGRKVTSLSLVPSSNTCLLNVTR